MEIWLNGQFVARDEASLSVFDAGVQHGVGLFETMTARNGNVFRLEEHLTRLIDSAKALRLTESLHREPLAEAVKLTLKRNGLDDARIRLTLTGGDLNYLQSRGKGRVDPFIFITAQPPTVYPPGFFEQGVGAIIAPGRDNPWHPHAGHKTLHYWPRIAALTDAAARSAGEAIWVSVTGHITSGSVSNIFVVKGDRLITPIARGEEHLAADDEARSLPSPVLPGITRAFVMEVATRFDLEVSRELLSPETLAGGDEVFLTNSSWGVLPVVRVGDRAIGTGSPGDLSGEFLAAWREALEL